MHISMLLSTGCFYFINIYCLYLYVFSSFSYSLALSCSSVLIRDHFHKGNSFFCDAHLQIDRCICIRPTDQSNGAKPIGKI